MARSLRDLCLIKARPPKPTRSNAQVEASGAGAPNVGVRLELKERLYEDASGVLGSMAMIGSMKADAVAGNVEQQFSRTAAASSCTIYCTPVESESCWLIDCCWGPVIGSVKL
jgi:hypothetical protein